MKKNMGNTDRLMRLLAAVIIGILVYSGVLQGTLAYVLLIMALIFAVTAIVNFCPLYSIFGFNTCTPKKSPR